MESYNYIRNAREDYEYLLKKFANYSKSAIWENDFVYLSRHNDEQLMKLFTGYGLARYQKERSEIDVFLKVLRWSHEVILYEKQKNYLGDESATSIIEFCKKEKATVNCRLHAIVLTESLLSLGYQARLACCLPIDVLAYDNHTITIVYSRELSKWIALDPSRNCCFLDKNGQMLSVSEIRQQLIRKEKIFFNYMHRFQKMNPDSRLVQFDDDWYLDYLYKNFFRFYCSRINGTTSKTSQNVYHLVPSGYSKINNRRFIYSEHYMSRTIMNTDDEEMFWAKPLEY